MILECILLGGAGSAAGQVGGALYASIAATLFAEAGSRVLDGIVARVKGRRNKDFFLLTRQSLVAALKTCETECNDRPALSAAYSRVRESASVVVGEEKTGAVESSLLAALIWGRDVDIATALLGRIARHRPHLTDDSMERFNRELPAQLRYEFAEGLKTKQHEAAFKAFLSEAIWGLPDLVSDMIENTPWLGELRDVLAKQRQVPDLTQPLERVTKQSSEILASVRRTEKGVGEIREAIFHLRKDVSDLTLRKAEADEKDLYKRNQLLAAQEAVSKIYHKLHRTSRAAASASPEDPERRVAYGQYLESEKVILEESAANLQRLVAQNDQSTERLESELRAIEERAALTSDDEFTKRVYTLRSEKNYDEADALYREALDQEEKREVELLMGHAEIQMLSGHVGRALESYAGAAKIASPEEAERIRKTISDAREMALRLNLTAEAYDLMVAEYGRSLDLFGPEDERTMSAMARFALFLFERGLYQDAKRLMEDALQLRQQQLGGEHPDTLSSMNNLGVLYGAMGRYADAETLCKKTLQLRQQQLGDEHPDTLSSMNNLAELYDATGRYGEAEPLFEETLRLRRKVLGEEHPDTLTSMNNRAASCKSTGLYREAVPLFEEMLRLRRKVSGEEHPDTLSSMNSLAELYDATGLYGEAEPLFEKTLRLRRKVLDKEHPETLTSMNNLAMLYYSTGRYGKAEPLFEKALRICRKVLDKEHPHTLVSMNNLALLYYSTGRYGEAEPLFEEALKVRRKLLTEEHPDTLTSRDNLALLYAATGRCGEAEPLYEETLRLRRRVLGEEHPDTLRSMNYLAWLYFSAGRKEKARSLAYTAYQIALRKLGSDNDTTKALAELLRRCGGSDP
ncbi:MAG: tetratricopeptide repeat protein [Armatimonadetes bacterium]|nr:tetratricopeptide repeat protein [Armatimonadota bacterium]